MHAGIVPPAGDHPGLAMATQHTHSAAATSPKYQPENEKWGSFCRCYEQMRTFVWYLRLWRDSHVWSLCIHHVLLLDVANGNTIGANVCFNEQTTLEQLEWCGRKHGSICSASVEHEASTSTTRPKPSWSRDAWCCPDLHSRWGTCHFSCSRAVAPLLER